MITLNQPHDIISIAVFKDKNSSKHWIEIGKSGGLDKASDSKKQLVQLVCCTVKQAAEQWAIEHHASDFGVGIDPVGGAEAAFLAGRKHFIENELREYLEMARKTWSTYYGDEQFAIDAIIQQALKK